MEDIPGVVFPRGSADGCAAITWTRMGWDNVDGVRLPPGEDGGYSRCSVPQGLG